MSFSSKPLLYNGFMISKNLKIKNRIERIYFTEVYYLDNYQYLYLFLDLESNNMLSRKFKQNFIQIRINSKTYVGIIFNDFSKERIYEIRNKHLQKNSSDLEGFDAVAGMSDLKNMLINDVINPLKNPEKFKKFKVSIPNGIILYGPPGCGKTFIVRKLAEELGFSFYEVKHSDLTTPFVHGSVGNIRKYFDIAKNNSPCVLFFDEISGLVPNRNNLNSIDNGMKEEEINEFLIQLNDAADKGILVVGATNFIERVDPAILRTGRFDKKFHVPYPDLEARRELFRVGLSGRPYVDVNLDHLALESENLSCSDIIEGVIESASRFAANNDLPHIDEKLLLREIQDLILNKEKFDSN